MKQINQMCFGCGPYNPIGLHLTFEQDGEMIYTEFTGTEMHQGYHGVIHGGIVSSILDEVMANHLYILGYTTMTAELEVRFSHALPIGQPIRFYSRVKSLRRHRVYEMEAWAELPDGTIGVRGRAKMMPLRVPELAGFQEEMAGGC